MIDRYPTLQDHVRDIVLVMDADSGRILEANRAAEYAYGYSRDELLAATIFDLRPGTSNAVSNQMRTADVDGILFEAVHRRKDGSTFPVEVSSRGETIDGQRVLLSIIRDISDRKRLELVREDFLSVASHELRTPVAVVSLQLQQLRRMIDRDEPAPRLRAEVGSALRQLERLDRLIDGLLNASQITSGRLLIEVSDGDLGELVREVCDRLAEHAARMSSPLVVDAPALPGRWDRMRIDQVVTNLVTNALKYGAGLPVHVVAQQEGDHVSIEVRDQGIGMQPEDLSRIFDKFERAVPAAHYGGLGLGLYITRQIVEDHGGRVTVSSTPGEGAVFRVVLPRITTPKR